MTAAPFQPGSERSPSMTMGPVARGRERGGGMGGDGGSAGAPAESPATSSRASLPIGSSTLYDAGPDRRVLQILVVAVCRAAKEKGRGLAAAPPASNSWMV